jgi:two-component system phosphate regulon response regulator PhoB
MLVEDNVPIRTLFARTLIKAGHTVIAFREGTEALRHLVDNMPDVAVVDLNLPGASGVDIMKYIRAQDHLRGTKIILASANNIHASSAEGRLADVILRKPVLPYELVVAVQRMEKERAFL